ncbi:MAG: tetratricopeptide repeat protein [Mariprofundus sp.]|nr:tetratricopeptide repeat protein [Mariprofundus sp.]
MAKLSNNKKRQLRGLADRAGQHWNQGQFEACEQLCKQMNALQAGNADAASLSGLMANHHGQPERAIEMFQAAIKAAPRRCEFHANLAGVYMMQGRADDALISYRRALKLKPKAFQLQVACAAALVALGRFEAALNMLLAVQKKRPNDVDVLMALFRACYQAGQTEEARIWLEKVLLNNPAHVEARYGLAVLLIEDGKAEAAEPEIREVLRLNPKHGDAAIVFSELKTYQQRDATVELLASMYADSTDEQQRLKFGFAYGKILDDLGEYDEAFRCFEAVNAIRKEQSDYDQNMELSHLDAVMQSYTPAIVQQGGGLEDRTPLFIVGMPRCGSTLVEQILASHNEVMPRGECGYFEAALHDMSSTSDMPFTLDALTSFEPDQWQQLGQRYVDKLRIKTGEATHYTDKSLSNIRLIGAIHCALPQAKIIHVRRHPLDTCWSIYRHNLLGGMFDFGHSLGDLGYYYRMYQRLMQHWREVLPDGVMIEVDYEDLVTDQEPQTRRLLDLCDLSWDERCLRFYQAEHAVRTASVMQVRRPMSSSSIGMWRHYEKHLYPLTRILNMGR